MPLVARLALPYSQRAVMTPEGTTASQAQPATHTGRYRYYDLIMAAFVCVLLCANLIGVSKIAQVQLFGHDASCSAQANCSSRSATCSATS